MSVLMPKNKIFTYSFCESFKDRLVDHILTQYADAGSDLSRLAVVFGGKRPALFLKRDLAKRFRQSFYPPRFFTIDEFMQYTIRKKEMFQPSRDLDSCFLLYKLAHQVCPQILKGRERFAAFLPWTREILNFIDQLDLENIEGPSLKNIQANAEIGYDVPKEINHLLESIVVLREAYHKALVRDKTYSRGLQYLKAAEVVGEYDFQEFDQILFCNFFYFHRTEERLVKNLHARGKATLIFQGDQRKWPVLQKIAKMFDCPIVEGEQPDPTCFALNIHAGFDAHSQVGLVRDLVRNAVPKENTVVVLPNPEQIIPLLSEVTSVVKDFNISMGYPLRRSSLYALMELIFKARLSAKDGRYYTKDYLKTLRHPFVKSLKLGSDSAVTRVLIHKLEEILTGQEKSDVSGCLFVGLDELESLDQLYILAAETLTHMDIVVAADDLRTVLVTIHDLLFRLWEGLSHFHGFACALEQFLDTLVRQGRLEHYPLNLNIAKKIYEIKDEFINGSFSLEKFTQDELFHIFEQKMTHEIISFQGSPLKGVQILGLLETRSLNFENVIILDVNEGVLPRLRIHEPLIPREVMIGLGLNRLELEEEIQRYQFMRLISSAKNVHLVYQESKEKERSRFIEELIWEAQKEKKTLDALPVTRAAYRVSVSPVKKTVKKTSAMIEFLRGRTYSASSINMYLRNPMEFYINYVLGLREQDDMLNEPDARHIGTFIHGLLEKTFKPFLQQAPRIDEAFRKRFQQCFEERFDEVFLKTMKSDAFLLKAVMMERLNRFLDFEQTERQPHVEKILYLEQNFDDVISLPAGDIRFRYVVDRVDQMRDGTVMILDYKTGGVDVMPKAVDQRGMIEFSRGGLAEQIKSFQLPLYFHYLNKTYPNRPVNAALYNLRTVKLLSFLEAKATAERASIDAFFLEALNFIIAEIFNPDVDFEDEAGQSG